MNFKVELQVSDLQGDYWSYKDALTCRALNRHNQTTDSCFGSKYGSSAGHDYEIIEIKVNGEKFVEETNTIFKKYKDSFVEGHIVVKQKGKKK